MASIPFYKLGILTIKTLTKPLSKKIKSYAATSPFFTKLCVSVSNTNNKVSYWFLRMTKNNKGHNKIKFKHINDKEAVEIGSNLIAEIFVYSVGGLLLIEEYTRNKISKIKEEKKLSLRLEKIEKELENLRKN